MALNHEQLAEELAQVRQRGLPQIRRLELPGLTEAAQDQNLSAGDDQPAAIEELLRRAVAALGGAAYGEAAAALLGLAPTTRGLGPRERRELAADLLGMSAETFRTRHQKAIVSDIANQILILGQGNHPPHTPSKLPPPDATPNPPHDFRRKLQVFVSSTYEDMKPERQSAVEAILEAGHIPAGMELFTAGDSSQWQVIQDWIIECDAFVLLLGGRYGSVEPTSGKSYIELEYDFARTSGKPTMALLATDKYLDKKVRKLGLLATERDNPRKLTDFKDEVTSNHVRFFNSRRNLKYELSLALRAVEARPGLSGWVREQPTGDLTLPILNRSLLFGTGSQNELEGSHNYYRIETFINTDPIGNTLIIGSPFLRYWFESPDGCRLERMLTDLPDLKAEVVLFSPTGSGSTQSPTERADLHDLMSKVQSRFPERLRFTVTDIQTDISYITYTIIPEGSEHRMRRLLVGLQISLYAHRPFFELLSPLDEPDHVTQAVMAFHETTLGDA